MKSEEEWRQVWEEGLPAYAPSGTVFLRLFKKILRRLGDLLLQPRLEQQRVFNLALMEESETRDRANREQLEQLMDLRKDLTQLHHDLQRIQDSFQRAFDELQSDTLRLRDDVLPAFMEESNAILEGVDRKAEWALARTRRFMESLRDEKIASIPPAAVEDLDYAAFQDAFRGTPEAISRDLAFYMEKIGESYPVWDLGCGRGEFIQLLDREGIPCRGVETNEIHCRALHSQGLDVIKADIYSALAGREDASIGTVTLFHVLEHLSVSKALDLMHLVLKKLKPGGLFILEVPNTTNLNGLFNFFKDPGHVTPWHPETLRYHLAETGFSPIEQIERHPLSEGDPIILADNAPADLARLMARLNTILYGPQDLASIAHKPEKR